jgi:SAM-dependent methyltransferase
MAIKRSAARHVNRVLARFGGEIVRTSTETRWDGQFRRWIQKAERAGTDPNDIGDRDWATDERASALGRWYLPLATPGQKIVELGPGTGRLTRHLVAAGADVTVVDRSAFVCEWIRAYLPGVDVQHTEGCHLPVPTRSADAFFAHGVFEHLLAEEAYWFLVEGVRVLKPAGKVVFNFDNVASVGGLEHLARTSSPDESSAFRFHHPAAIAALARKAGYTDVQIETSDSRVGFALLTRADAKR